MISITPMEKIHIPQAVSLWEAQFDKYCGCDDFPRLHERAVCCLNPAGVRTANDQPRFDNGGRVLIEEYLANQINEGNALAAVENNLLVGFMAWMYFDFHNERTAFVPITGHGASLKGEAGIYEGMYNVASQKWVSDDRFNHLWMVFFEDEILKDSLYETGFGSYVVDACKSTAGLVGGKKSEYDISLAAEGDADNLLELVSASTGYYISAPIFLKRDEHTRDEIVELIRNDYVVISRDGNKIVGAMSFGVNENFHLEHLTTPESARIRSIGAFIHPDYRGKGIGTALLEKVIEVCKEKGKKYVHVSYESANPNAARFWPKYFNPAIRSVRRTINKDANF